MTNIKILDRPENNKYEYEFEVVVATKQSNIYKHIEYYTNGYEAEKMCLSVNGVILHNIKVSGKKVLTNKNK